MTAHHQAQEEPNTDGYIFLTETRNLDFYFKLKLSFRILQNRA